MNVDCVLLDNGGVNDEAVNVRYSDNNIVQIRGLVRSILIVAARIPVVSSGLRLMRNIVTSLSFRSKRFF